MILTKIRKLELQDVWTISRNSSRFKENVFIQIQKDGITGYGEAAPNIRYGENAPTTEESIGLISETLLKQDFHQHAQVKEFWNALSDMPNCAKAALDMALMDWVAKSRCTPLYKMLGLNGAQTPLTSFSIGMDTIDVIKKKITQAADYPILKIKVGSPNDRDIIEAVRTVTDKPIRVDANEGWKDKETAVRMIEWMQGQGVEFIEQPMPANMLEETAWVRQRVNLPLVADEDVLTSADIPSLSEVYDGINIKLMKASGIQEALNMIHTARAHQLKVMLGCMVESSLAVTAAAHLSPLADWADLDGNLLICNDPFVGVKVAGGRLILNDLPGLGVTGNW